MLIIILIVVFMIASFGTFMYLRKALLRWTLGSLSVFLLALSILLMLGNFAWNWGTKEVTTTDIRPIYTAGPTNVAYNILIQSEIGNKSGNYAFVFRDSENGRVKTHFVPDTSDIINAVKKTASAKDSSSLTASVKTVTIKRTFSSDMTKLLFDIGNNDNILIKQHSTVSISSATWLVLDEAQAKQLEAAAPKLEAEQKAELAADPQKALALEQLQKTNPTAFAELQISVIKQALGLKK